MFDFKFTRNLSATALLLALLSLGLAEVHDHPETAVKQQRFGQMEKGMKMVGVIKAQQLRYRK